jgi:hypothetical protein
MNSWRGWAAGRIALSILGLVLGEGFAQPAEHQRVGVETEARHAIELGLSWAWSLQGYGWIGDAEAHLEYSWQKAFGLCLSLPFSGEFSAAGRGDPWSWRWGDPCVSASRLWRGEGLRVLAGIGYIYPLGAPGRLGFHAISPSLSLALVRDPVILALGLDARLCLPRKAQGYLLWPPFSGDLSLSAWELLNDRVSYRISITPGLSLGVLRLGLDESIVPRWSLGLALSFSWNERSCGLGAGWSGSADSGAGAPSLSMDLQGDYRREW